VKRDSCNDALVRAVESGNRADRSRSHGYENDWEETHSEQEGQSSQDGEEGHARRKEDRAQNRAYGTQDRTRDCAGGAQNRTQDWREENRPGEAGDRAEDNCKEDIGCKEDLGAQAGSTQAGGSQSAGARSAGAETRSRGEAGRSTETRSPRGRRGEAGSGAHGPAATPSRPPFARHGKQLDAAAPRGPNGRRQRAGSLGAASGDARCRAKLEPEPAALPAVLGTRRRRYVNEARGGLAS